MKRPNLVDELMSSLTPPKRPFRAYDDNRVLFTVYGEDEQRALEAAMERCLDEGIGYIERLHVVPASDG